MGETIQTKIITSVEEATGLSASRGQMMNWEKNNSSNSKATNSEPHQAATKTPVTINIGSVAESEEMLFSGLRNKNKFAFQYLYDNYSSALYGVIFNILSHKEASDDTLQEVFVKIWGNFDSYDPQRSRLYTWMLNIARYHAIDKLRSKEMKCDRHLKRDKEFAKKLSFSPAPFVEGIGLKKLLDYLDKEQKDVIELVYFQGFTHTEAAEELNIPLGTVKTRLRLAIIKLRTIFL